MKFNLCLVKYINLYKQDSICIRIELCTYLFILLGITYVVVQLQ